jgi:cyclopropane fatty-acyl-phospholipid synthase-like methyltransferase
MKARERIKQIYEHIDKWHADQTQAALDKYADIIKSCINPGPNDIILDMGCGDGEITHRLSKFCKRIDGCDSSCRLISKAQAKFPKLCFFEQDILKIPANGNSIYNKVFSYSVIQHIGPKELSGHFSFICSILEKRGKVFFLDVPDKSRSFAYYVSKKNWFMPKLRGFMAFILTYFNLNKYIYRWDYSYWHSFRQIKSIAKRSGFNFSQYDKSECYYRMHIALRY